jgi:GNAT superfamily N-acetyltransferase
LVKLPDGTPVLLRLFTPADRAAVLEAFRSLSLDSHYYRFWTRHRELPDSLLNRFLNPEPGLHETWAAQDPAAPEQPGYGGGSFWRQTEDPWRAEISLTVADGAQHRGVGLLLLAQLWLRARLAGVTEFYGVVLPDNYTVLDWFRALGARIRLERGQYDFVLGLDEEALKDTPTSARLKERLAELRSLGLEGTVPAPAVEP